MRLVTVTQNAVETAKSYCTAQSTQKVSELPAANVLLSPLTVSAAIAVKMFSLLL